MDLALHYLIGNVEILKENYEEAYQRLKTAEKIAEIQGKEIDKFNIAESMNLLEWKIFISEQEKLLEEAINSDDWRECINIGDKYMPNQKYIPNVIQNCLYSMRKYHTTKAYNAAVDIAKKTLEPEACYMISQRYAQVGMMDRAKMFYETGNNIIERIRLGIY